VGWSSITIAAAVRAATIAIHAITETYVGTIVLADDRLRLVDKIFGLNFALERVAFGIVLQMFPILSELNSLETIGGVNR
jgi:hypothetical protein